MSWSMRTRCPPFIVEQSSIEKYFPPLAAKALGTGIWRHGIAWTDIEVVRAEHGAPSLHFYNAAQQRAAILGWSAWSVSLSHDRERAIAFVVAMTDPTLPYQQNLPPLPDQ